jgi:hypothetical protein
VIEGYKNLIFGNKKTQNSEAELRLNIIANRGEALN